jgi:multicomponent Na+:H+ antiporter subunit D
LPPSGGFTAKYLLLTSAIASGQWWWAAVIIAGGLLAAAYLFRVLNRFLSEPEDGAGSCPGRAPRQIIALGLAGVSILLGLFSLGPYDLLQIGRLPATVEGLS